MEDLVESPTPPSTPRPTPTPNYRPTPPPNDAHMSTAYRIQVLLSFIQLMLSSVKMSAISVFRFLYTSLGYSGIYYRYSKYILRNFFWRATYSIL